MGAELLESKGYAFNSEEYLLDKNSQRFYGLHAYSHPDSKDKHFAIGMRSSHDKSTPFSVTAGLRVIVCSNGMFTGEMQTSHRHTGNVIETMKDNIILLMFKANNTWQTMQQDCQVMGNIELNRDRQAHFFGSLFRLGLLTGEELLEANRLYREPPHTEFKEPTAWSAYNAVTEVYKRLSPTDQIVQHRDLHKVSMDIFNQWSPEGKKGKLVDVIA